MDHTEFPKLGTVNEHAPYTNYAFEYHQARKMMGTKGTNLQHLSYCVGLLYLNCPDEWSGPYLDLLDEIDLRWRILNFPELYL